MSLAAGFIIKFILFFFKIQQIIKMELYTEEILKIYKKIHFKTLILVNFEMKKDTPHIQIQIPEY